MFGRRTYSIGAVCSALSATVHGAAARPPVDRHGSQPYRAFLSAVAADARRAGISAGTIRRALLLQHPNSRVLALDRRQPEFTLSWAEYRRRLITVPVISLGRDACARRRRLLERLGLQYRVDPGVVAGIWGLESRFGQRSGSFGVFDSLASLGYLGRRHRFFATELLSALRVAEVSGIDPRSMLGSYAGAMGQPQFMPSTYLRYAVDYNQDGKRDIWSDDSDSLASIFNYLAKSGWTADAPWGQPVSVGSAASLGPTGREVRRPLGEWTRRSVRRLDGSNFSREDVLGALLLPDGSGGDAFMVYSNFDVIRRYNASDFYSLAVGLLGGALL